MKLVIQVEPAAPRAGQTVTVRLLAINDTPYAAEIDRRLLIGPSVAPEQFTGLPPPISIESPQPVEDHNVVRLDAFGVFGRERTFEVGAGATTFHAYLLKSPTERLLPAGPVDPALLAVAADSITLHLK
jgi:hypothetical protein